jgi:hypothetical protein
MGQPPGRRFRPLQRRVMELQPAPSRHLLASRRGGKLVSDRGSNRRSDRKFLLEAVVLGGLMLLGLASSSIGYLEALARP